MTAALLLAISLTFLVDSGVAQETTRPQAPPRHEPVVTRALQIDLPSGGTWPVAVGADHAVFYLPVVGKGEMLGVIAISTRHFVGIRIIPSLREDRDSVRIDVSALVSGKKTLSEANCRAVDPGRVKTQVLMWRRKMNP